MKSQPRERLKVVLDTNTVISAALSGDGNPAAIFELLLLEAIENYTSPEIIAEIRSVFQRDRIRKRIQPEDAAFIVREFTKRSRMVRPTKRISVVHEDPADNRILECAETGDVNFIISGDQHLTKRRSYQGIGIVTPRQFLECYARRESR